MTSRARSRADSSSPPPVRLSAAPQSAQRRQRSNSRARRSYYEDDYDPSPSPSPAVRHRRHRSSGAGPGYVQPREKYHTSNKIDLLFCVFASASSHTWRTAPYTFDRRRINDHELWEDIREIYRSELQKPWRRFFFFKRLKLIAPITYTRNEVPIRVQEKDLPDKHSYMHAYHHPDQVRPAHDWVDFFTKFSDQNPDKKIGLEFIEGLWAQKLALLAVAATIAIIAVSIAWCVLGGELQTVFTVMSFVLTGVAAELALLTLYYQVTLPN